MATFFYNVDDTKRDGAKLHGEEWDIAMRQLTSQLQGALAAQGSGVLAVPDRSALEAEIVGGALVVRPGMVLLRHAPPSRLGVIFAWVQAPQTLNITAWPDPEGNGNYLLVGPRIAPEDTPSAPDTRQDMAPVLAIQGEDHADGFVLLARITCAAGAPVSVDADVRAWSPLWGGEGDWKRLFGAGRVVASELGLGAATVVQDPPLVRLPAGSVWFINGQVISLATAVDIDIPEDLTDAWGLLSLDENGMPTILEEDWLAQMPPRGVGVVGRLRLVTVGTDESFVISDTRRDIVQVHAGLQARLEAIEAFLVPSTDGETIPRFMVQLPVSPQDGRDAKTYVDAENAAQSTTLRAEFELLLATGGHVSVPPELDLYHHQLAILILQASLYQTIFRDEHPGAFVTHRVGGEGSGGTVNHLGPGNMTDTEDGWAP